jgi:hypothetical protein
VIVIDESTTSGLDQAGADAVAHDWLTATGGAISYGTRPSAPRSPPHRAPMIARMAAAQQRAPGAAVQLAQLAAREHNLARSADPDRCAELTPQPDPLGHNERPVSLVSHTDRSSTPEAGKCAAYRKPRSLRQFGSLAGGRAHLRAANISSAIG